MSLWETIGLMNERITTLENVPNQQNIPLKPMKTPK